MAHHEITVCSEGFVVAQCRCPADSKTVKTVPHETYCTSHNIIIHLESSRHPKHKEGKTDE